MFDLDSIKSGEQMTEEQLKDLFEKTEETSENALPENLAQGKEPAMSFNPVTMAFEPVDIKIKELREKRNRLKHQSDPLAEKEGEIKRGLEEIGLPAENMGKTGDSRTGKVTDEQKKVAESQTEDAKCMMLAEHRRRGR